MLVYARMVGGMLNVYNYKITLNYYELLNGSI